MLTESLLEPLSFCNIGNVLGTRHFANSRFCRFSHSRRQAKIALKASSEDELLELEAIAKSLNLCARSIQDAGRTQIAAGSRTVLGIGPGQCMTIQIDNSSIGLIFRAAPVALVNQVTGKLRLL